MKTKVMKKEKKVKVVPTEEQVKKMVSQYLNKSSYHIFNSRYVWNDKFNENSYYKVLPVKVGEKLYCVEMKLGNNKVSFKLRDTSWVSNKNQLGMLKNEVFPQYIKHKAVNISYAENKRAMGEMFYNIKNINVSTGAELKEKIEKEIETFKKTVEILNKNKELRNED